MGINLDVNKVPIALWRNILDNKRNFLAQKFSICMIKIMCTM